MIISIKGEIMERKLHEHICVDCGEKFYTFGVSKRTICDDCKKRHKVKWQAERYKSFKSVKNEHSKKQSGASLTEIMKEIEEYNRIHGTYLSYGQYINLTNK